MKAFHTKPVWTSYTGTCNPLNEDIQALGIKNFSFEMLYTCPSSPWTKWAETHEHFIKNVVFDPSYYNDRAGLIRWAPAKGAYDDMKRRMS